KEQGVGLRFYVSHVDLFSGTGIPLSGSHLSNIGAARGDILHLGARSMSVQPFDDRDGVIWYDGKFVDWRDANIHILTHAMHYASAVFEGERVYEGKVFRLTDHSERLVRSAELLGFKIPYSVAEIDAATNESVKRSGFKDAYVRPIAW